MTVFFNNNAAFSCRFSVQWNGGQSGETELTYAGDSVSIDLDPFATAIGTGSCWGRAYIVDGVNHDSGNNFTLSAGNVTYTISGGADTPSFSCDGCNC